MNSEITSKLIRVSKDSGYLSAVYLENKPLFLFLERFEQSIRIPRALYECRLTWSPRFQCPLPILSVVGRQGIRIHAGNKQQDSQGCILIGKYSTHSVSAITESRTSLNQFIKMFWDKNPNNVIKINLKG